MRSILLAVLIGLLTFSYSNSCSQTPDWGWARSAGGVENDYAFYVAVDASGNA